MSVLLVVGFALLVVGYVLASEWAGMNPNYLMLLAVLIFIPIVLLDLNGNLEGAYSLAEFVVVLISGGVSLMAFKQIRTSLPLVLRSIPE